MQPRRITDDPYCSLVGQDGRGTGYGSLGEEAIKIPQPSSTAPDQKSTANVFSDGSTRINFVLVWETIPWERSGLQDSHENGDLQERSATIHRTWRKDFLDKLRAAGIHMEKHVTHVEKKVVRYLLLAAPWSVLRYYAEGLWLRVPLQTFLLPRQTSNWLASVLWQLGIPDLMAQEVPNLPLDCYTCPFKANKLHWFLGRVEQDTFFSITQRHQILYEILATTWYSPSKEREVGVDRLLSENIFTAAFPLHEARPHRPPGSHPTTGPAPPASPSPTPCLSPQGPYKLRPEELAAGSLGQCQILFQYWANWGKWNKYQPLDHVRKCFGEKVAFCFAWLGESCLLQSSPRPSQGTAPSASGCGASTLPAAAVGTVVFVAGIFLMLDDVPSSVPPPPRSPPPQGRAPFTPRDEGMGSACIPMSWRWLAAGARPQHSVQNCRQESCTSKEQYWMCPLCKTCPYWQLSQIFSTFMVGRLFGHDGTIFFSFFMSLWAVLFLVFWKRTITSPAHHWDCSEFKDIEEGPWPQFTAMAPTTIINPVTGMEEPYFPKRSHRHRILVGSMIIIMPIVMVVVFVVSVILYRAVVTILLFVASASRIASIPGSVVNLIFILFLSKICISLAHFLTKWEIHRTQTKYEDAFIFNVFQFVTFYSSPVYIAFFKGNYPGNYLSFLGVRNEEVSADPERHRAYWSRRCTLPGHLPVFGVLRAPCARPGRLRVPLTLRCSPGGCFIELAQELPVIMVGKQIINNVQEVAIPKLKWWHKHKLLSTKKVGEKGESVLVEQVPWVMDHQLLAFEGLFEEYQEIVLQFGFITIFAAACPLSPLFALLSNWVEIRLDAHKFVCGYRRPVAERVQGIGIWVSILEALTHLAIISDVRWVGRYRAFRDRDGNLTLTYWQLLAIRVGFVIAFEHAVVLIGCAVAWLVPDIPESVEVKVKCERYQAKEALAENKVLLGRWETRNEARVTDPAAGRDWESEHFASS
ncbi:LOW QUALITY PROTEIN: anoctamin-7 [Cariama cristata]